MEEGVGGNWVMAVLAPSSTGGSTHRRCVWVGGVGVECGRMMSWVADDVYWRITCAFVPCV